MADPWITAEHPDPEGFHLRTIAALLDAYCKYFNTTGHTFGVFLDFCSLEQAPRSEEAEERFRRGLKAINLIYAHQVSFVLCLTVMPPGTARGYDARGWCFFERLVAGALKQAQYLLDVGKLKVAPDAVTNFHAEVMEVCDVGRRPPLTPAAFEAELRERQFTNGSTDHALVARLYGEFVEEALGAATRLNFARLGWGDAQAEELAAVLPLCGRVRDLNLGSNAIGDRGAAALARSLPAGLETLDLNNNDSLTDEGVAALAAALPASVRAFNVQDQLRKTPLRCPITNARTREAVDTIRRFYAGGDATQRAVVAEVAAAKEEAAKAAESGPAEVDVDGVRCARRIRCSTGGVSWGDSVAGVWYLSQEEPLIDGAPHYEHAMPGDTGEVYHLYRLVLSTGGRRWFAGPTPGADAGWANVDCINANHDLARPTDVIGRWTVDDGKAWGEVEGFRFDL
ncbi:MAG TPA: hypothetical protein RMH80_17650 [Polyangiaceae bacterium LLY-WYZ-15_(1-7)]|nr:hypothetical protein [Polyangiaceae bacterium LLY-WYZ-15_(1-7)]